MHRWLRAPSFADAETTRQAELLYRLLRAMVLLSLLAAGASAFDSRNEPRVTVEFYAVVLAWLAGVMAIVRTGRVVLAAWIFSSFFWCIIAFVTLVFGGLQGQNASVFAVCTLLIGSIVGGRAALAMAFVSSAWCGLVAYLEVHGRLPPQLGPYAPGNAWAALTVTVLLTSVLLHASLASLRRVHAEAQQAAAERDEALRRSIQGQKMELVGNLTSGVAHDLNNLLTVIVGTSDILRMRVEARDAATVSLLDDLEGAASRASLMTRQLLTFGRLESSEHDRLDFGAILLEMSKMLPRLLGHAVSVEVEAGRDCEVMASRAGLEQILLNLAINARDAMPEGGKLRLELSAAEDEVVLSAADTGIGMTEEVQARIFEPFFTTKATGTGLGLATVKQLADHYGGTIELESTVGQGTRFTVRFPRAPRKEAPASDPQATDLASRPRATHSRGRILLAEDDALVRKALRRALEAGGYDVFAVEDGAQAVRALETEDAFDCIVSDVAMPNLDGEALARHVTETRPDLPMVLLSGNRQPSSALSPSLPRTFLMKPIGGDELRDAVARVIARRAISA
ncbi:MAG TPA: ATP-binding protein [Polyangiaceae bacterium]|jgi:signal transduction histidine kinase/CheY-like chemotaxis protein|nr:ATP-binding protein [Polyangiaceae bacterium]